jgi:antirestriction protein ArdC
MSNAIYESITNKIIAELETGAAPWVKPWRADSTADHNLVSKKPYSGVNRLILGMAGMQYSSDTWATYKQISEAGGNVRKGEKGTHIVFFKPVTKETQTANGQTETESFAVIKSYCVFNASQCDGLELPTPASEPTEFTAIELAEQRIAKTGAIVSHGGDAAFYMPSADRIQLPNRPTFATPANYYATAFHELIHWSGADHRLNRNLSKGRFGNPAYAFEELVAELGAAFLCQDHAIDGELRHAGYIGSWLKALRDDKTAIFKAAALAQKAADYVNKLDATAIIKSA